MTPMTEAEWLGGWSYRRMYDLVRGQSTNRQVRLYMVACCRIKAAAFPDPRIARAIEAAERCADDPQVEAEADAAWDKLVTSPRPRDAQHEPEGDLARVITDVWRLLDECWGGVRYPEAKHAIAHAAFMSLRDSPGTVFTGGDGDAAHYCARAVDCADLLQSGVKPEEVEQDEGLERETETRRAMANILRDIFGNPFRPAAPPPPAVLAWNDGTVRRIAQGIYDGRAFGYMPILADALVDAGCADEEVLQHCRQQEASHTRGCWVIDVVLGKS
jgi:hypothetical protein